MSSGYARFPDGASVASFELLEGTDLRFDDVDSGGGVREGDLDTGGAELGAIGAELASPEPFEPLEFGSVRFTPTGLDLSGVESVASGAVDERFDPSDLAGWDVVEEPAAELPDIAPLGGAGEDFRSAAEGGVALDTLSGVRAEPTLSEGLGDLVAEEMPSGGRRETGEDVREPNGPGFSLYTGRGTQLDVDTWIGGNVKWALGFGSKLQSVGGTAARHEATDVDLKGRGRSGIGQVYGFDAAGHGYVPSDYTQVGPFSLFPPYAEIVIAPDGRTTDLTHTHVSKKFRIVDGDIGKWAEKVPGKTELSFEMIGGLGGAVRRHDDGALDARSFALSAGGKTKLATALALGEKHGSLKLEVSTDYQSQTFLGVTLDPREPERLAPLNRRDTELARLDLDNLYRKHGTDGVLSQFANQRFLSEDGRVLNHGAPLAGQIQNALNVLGETELGDRPLFSWNEHSPDDPPDAAALAWAIDRAIVEGGVPPEAFAGPGGLDFGRTDVGAVNHEVHGVDEAQVDRWAGDYLYTPLAEHQRFTDAGTIVDMSHPLVDREVSAVDFDPAKPVDGDLIFPGVGEVGARIAHDVGTFGGDVLLRSGTGALGLYEGTLGVVDTAFDDARRSVGDFLRGGTELAGEVLGETAEIVRDGVDEALRGGEGKPGKGGPGGLKDVARGFREAFTGIPGNLREGVRGARELLFGTSEDAAPGGADERKGRNGS